MRANEIAERLAVDAEGVASYLLPNGKRDGAEWVCGNLDGDPGKSLKVHLRGTKAGVWKDFAEGSGGDLLGLWMKVNGQSLIEAMRDAKDYLGIRDTDIHRDEPMPKLSIAEKTSPKDQVYNWLRGRGISDNTLKAYKIQQHGLEVIFPYLIDGNLAFAKYRNVTDKKKMRTLEGGRACLFGWQAVDPDAREVLITEGEMDALAWFEMGIPALSVPTGAKALNWVECEYNRLERFDLIYIAFDMDKDGQEGALRLIDRLGRERCRLINTGHLNDGNDALLAGAKGHEYLDRARWIDPAELKSAADYADQVVSMLEHGPDHGPGFDTPWAKLRHLLRFRESELIVVNGVNGHGKSELMGQIILSGLKQDYRGLIYSGEFKPERLLFRMDRQSCGSELTTHKVRAAHNWYQDKLWIFELTGSAKADRLLEVFTYARRRYGIKMFVIDSLLKCGIAEDDYNGQKAFVERLTDFKNEHDAIVFLVTHSRKGESEDKPTGKMDVRGSGTITDLADTVLNIWRNKPKEKKISELDMLGAEIPKDVEENFDGLLSVNKQRNGEWEQSAALWFDRQTHQFLGGRNEAPTTYSGVRAV